MDIIVNDDTGFLKSCIDEDKKFLNVKKWNQYKRKIKTNASINNVDLSGLNLSEVDFSNLLLVSVNLKNTKLDSANLSGIHVDATDFSKSSLRYACLSKANLQYSNLSEVNLNNADLKKANLNGSTLDRAYLFQTNLIGTILSDIKVESQIAIKDCKLSKKTDLRNVNLNKINFSKGTMQTVEYVNRRLNWKDWYRMHRFLKYIVEPFWECSNYGRSITRVLNVFLIISFLFSFLYFFFPDVLDGLVPLDRNSNEIILSEGMKFLRTLYFSIVTMTTLGFGDIHAAPNSICGYLLLITQVVLGYGLLGALVTCLSVMFTSDGPAQPLEEELNTWYKKLYKKAKEKLDKASVKMGIWGIFFILYVIAVIMLS